MKPVAVRIRSGLFFVQNFLLFFKKSVDSLMLIWYYINIRNAARKQQKPTEVMKMWKKDSAGQYTYKDYTVYQIDGLGWCLLKGNKGAARFKTFAKAKAYVARQSA